MDRCILCNKKMKESNELFGHGCVKNIYAFIDMPMPKKVKLREKTLYRNVMKITGIKGINEYQKKWLTDRYLTYQYIDRIPYRE